MKEEGAPKDYPITPIVSTLGENEDFDDFVAKLCDEIKAASDEREKTLEPS